MGKPAAALHFIQENIGSMHAHKLAYSIVLIEFIQIKLKFLSFLFSGRQNTDFLMSCFMNFF